VLCWLTVPAEDLAAAVAAEVDVAISAPWAVDQARAAAHVTGRPARVHLKVDTGLTRGGARPDEDWDDLVVAAAKAQAAGELEVVGISSHLVHADTADHPTTSLQVEIFTTALEAAERRGLRPAVRHLASSGAVLSRPDTHFDLVRPGIAIYGLSPLPATAAELGLRPAMTLAADVALVKRVPAGTGISYGHTHKTATETTVALVPLGYADGIPRSASNAAEVLVAGARRRIAGRVCMDQLVVEVGDDAVVAGDEALLFGPGHQGEPTAQDWADALGTISYEIVTRIGARVPRTYVGATA
jgi:alanine racemase